MRPSGKKKGTPLTDAEEVAMIAYYAEDGTVLRTAEHFNVSRTTVNRVLARRPEVAEVVQMKKQDNQKSMLEFLTTKNDEAQTFVDKCLTELNSDGKLQGAQVNQITTAMGTVIDKFAPLAGQQDDSEKVYRMDSLLIADGFQPMRRSILQGKHTEYVATGGRGSTKSSFFAFQLVEVLMNNPNVHALVTRHVADTLKDSVYSQLKWAIREMGLDDEFMFYLSPLEIVRKKTKQKIYFRGADDPQKIKSITPEFGYIGVLWLEELDQFAGDAAIRSIEQSAIRGGDDAWIFKSFNPPVTQDNWANKYVKIPKDSQYHIHTNYKDSGVPPEWLGKTFLEEAEHLKQTNPRAYEHEYLGIPNRVGGMVFENVEPKVMSDEMVERFDRIYNGVDFGWFPDPWAYNRMHYDASRRELYIFGEETGNKLSNQKTAKILQKWMDRSEFVTCDSAEPKSISDYAAVGIRARGAEKGPGSVDYSMKWLQSLNAIYIDHTRCPATYQEFSEYEYQKNKDGEVVSGYPDHNNHHIDATRYAMERVWKHRETPRQNLV